ncbi:polymer-forming cytoskeletal protein [Hydrogenibacillus schlegelii]|uniref:Polymer-forming cytoskeletal protein n=2 Tax=Hydrogenibacillus schlegelii TaxID=1484 RepID=A0A947G9V7_HYDSH|nr:MULTISPECIES: polymer-forming cytoskeletal protein [Hydrogenibacillus]MBE3562868.1 polymer-forming cytoskeletal protein [Hydrogenibacillus schlegelii]MBT9282145.1 polymer-forming cytoskeletal protein [Hydrogenibacillus schlegelii]QZA32987.1 polymer-forming cytoskeletal protein [Hydrogenibacillus sp. N12]
MWKREKPRTESPAGMTVIDAGTRLEGHLFATAAVRIDGTVEGDVTVEGALAIGATGQVHGTVRAREAHIAGKVRGDLFVAEALVLERTADIEGTVEYAVLAVEEGASLTGTVRKKAADPPAEDGGRRSRFQTRIRPHAAAPEPGEAAEPDA